MNVPQSSVSFYFLFLLPFKDSSPKLWEELKGASTTRMVDRITHQKMKLIIINNGKNNLTLLFIIVITIHETTIKNNLITMWICLKPLLNLQKMG